MYLKVETFCKIQNIQKKYILLRKAIYVHFPFHIMILRKFSLPIKVSEKEKVCVHPIYF